MADMTRHDISTVLDLVNKSPDTAATDLNNSTGVDVDPVSYSESAEAFKPTAQKETLVSRAIAETMQSSPDAAAAMSKDVNQLSTASKWIRYGSLSLEQSDISRRRGELSNKKRIGRQSDPNFKLPEAEETELQYLREDGDAIGSEMNELDIGVVGEGIAGIPTFATDTLKDMWRQKKLVAGATLAGAGVGAAGTLILNAVPVLGTLGFGASTIGAAGTGLAFGTFTASFIENRQRMVGETYDELGLATDENGVALNIDEKTKDNIANGVGTLSAAVESVADKLLADKIPFLKKIMNPRFARNAMKDPINRAIFDAVGHFGKEIVESGLIEGGTEGFQEIVGIIGEEMGQTWDGSAASLPKALQNMTQKIVSDKPVIRDGKPVLNPDGTPRTYRQDYAERTLKSAAVGAVAGSGMVAGGKTIGRVGSEVKKATKGLLSDESTSRGSVESGSLPINNEPEPVLAPQVQEQVDQSPARVVNRRQIVDSVNAQKSINFAIGLQAMHEGVANSTIGKKAGEHAAGLQVQMARDSGIYNVWIAKEDLDAWNDSEAKQKFIEENFDVKAFSDEQLGAMMVMDPAALMKAMQMDSKFSQIVRENPQAMTFKEIMTAYENGEKEAQDFLQKGGTARAEAQAEVTLPETADLGLASTDEEVKAIVKSKQKAYEYIDRLTTEETRLMNDRLTPETEERLTKVRDMQGRIASMVDELVDEDPDTDINLSPDELLDASIETYLNQPLFTDMVRAGVPQNVIKGFATEHQKIRQQIADGMKQAGELEMFKTASEVAKIAETETAQATIDALANDPEIEIVEQFLNNDKLWWDREYKAKKGYPIYAMDPSLLNDVDFNRFSDDAVLAERKAFVKGGLDPDTVAKSLNLPNARALLNILRKTPTKQEAAARSVELHKTAISAQSLASVDIMAAPIIKALDNKQKMNLREMKALVESSWAKARQGVEGVVFAKLNLKEIQAEAKDKVMRTKVNTLNPRMYETAAIKARKKALKAANRGNFLEASKQRELEIKNTEMYKQTLIANARVSKAIKTIVRLTRDKKIQQVLKDAGMKDAFESLSSIINLGGEGKVSDRRAFDKWVKKMIRERISDPSVPAEVAAGYDPKAELHDLSLEQLIYLQDKMKEIVSEAVARNEHRQGQEIIYINQLEESVQQKAESHPDYNPDTPKEKLKEPSPAQQLGIWLTNIDAGMTNVNYITKNLDQGDPNGLFSQLFYHSVKGTGLYDNGYGEKAAIEWRAKATGNFSRAMEKAGGQKRFDQLGTERIKPPEFRNANKSLLSFDGTITKLELLGMMILYGHEEGRRRLGNFGITPDDVLKVAQRELTKTDIQFIHEGIYGTYEMFKPAIIRNQKEMGRDEVDFVQGKGYTFQGVQFDGGYSPLSYSTVTLSQAIKDSKAEVERANNGVASYGVAEQFTLEGHLKARALNYNGIPDISLSSQAKGFEQMIMDVTMAVPLKETMRLLNNEKIAHSIINVVGLTHYNTLKSHIMTAAVSQELDALNAFGDTSSWTKNLSNTLRNNMSKSVLAYVPKTIFIQTTSAVFAWKEGGGLRATPDYLVTLAKMFRRPWMISNFMDAAAEIDPTIRSSTENIDVTGISGMYDMIPKNQSRLAVIRGLKKLDQVYAKGAFKMLLGNMDAFLKTAAALTMQKRFLQGKVKGWPVSKLETMTETERVSQSKAYVVKTNQGTLTAGSTLERAAFQKLYPSWTPFFNDVRNQYNLATYDLRTVKQDVRSAKKAVEEKDYRKAGGYLVDAGTTIIQLQFYNALAATIVNAVSGRDDEGEEMDHWLTPEWFEQLASAALRNMINPLAVLKNMLNALPVIRDIYFSTSLDVETAGRVSVQATPIQIRAAYEMGMGLWALNGLIVEGELDEKQRKQIIRAVGAGTGLPTNAYLKLERYMEDYPVGPVTELMDAYNKSVPYGLMKVKEDALKRGDKDVADTAQAVKDEIDPNNTIEADLIASGKKAALSSFEKKMIGTLNPTGTGGKYQFRESDWNALMNQRPDLGLTEAGRFQTSGEQQEKALDALNKNNGPILLKAQVPLTTETVYAAQQLGTTKVIEIWKMDDSADVTKVLAGETREWLKDVKTAKQFKDKLADMMIEAERKVDEQNLD